MWDQVVASMIEIIVFVYHVFDVVVAAIPGVGLTLISLYVVYFAVKFLVSSATSGSIGGGLLGLGSDAVKRSIRSAENTSSKSNSKLPAGSTTKAK